MQKSVRTIPPHPGQQRHTSAHIPFDCVALLLQGGGALGAYQGGVYEALAEIDLHPDWVAGISIGAINAALIAGNPPQKRVEKLRAFWEKVTSNPFGLMTPPFLADGQMELPGGDVTRGLIDQIGAMQALLAGASGFFTPRLTPPWLAAKGGPEATSYYDTSALQKTLESLVDFDRINHREMRFSVGAVNVKSGNFIYFDNSTHTITAKHILASGALPPGFPAVEIDGEYYWDGGLVSNTPLQWVVDSEPREHMLAFQVDLWNARGDLPKDLGEVATRQKEIQFSSRTRAKGDKIKSTQKIRAAVEALLQLLPEELRATEQAKILAEFAACKSYNIVQLIYRSKTYEENSKDYEFSRLSMIDHWHAGYDDALYALAHPEIYERPHTSDGYRSFDFSSHPDHYLLRRPKERKK